MKLTFALLPPPSRRFSILSGQGLGCRQVRPVLDDGVVEGEELGSQNILWVGFTAGVFH